MSSCGRSSGLQVFYDRLEWDFVQAVLHAFGFDQKWIDWVMGCISSVSYKIRINEICGEVFQPSRGLRQGDPISPYIFVLAMEVLAVMLSRATREGRIQGIKFRGVDLGLSHLFFADDTMIMTSASVSDAFEIQQLLNLYTEASGQRINVNKSGIVFSKDVHRDDQVKLADVFRMPIWDSPGKYLGLPSDWGRSKAQTLSWIKDKVWSHIQGWKEKLLSQAGKEILIKSVIQAIPSYAMSVVKFPKSFCKSLSSMVARFWWSAASKQRGIHWVKWAELTKSKFKGGMGFKDFTCMNLAHLETLKAIYFPNSDFWEAKKTRGCSWSWSSLMEGRDFLKKHSAWQVGDGRAIKVWKDKWVGGDKRLWPADSANRELKVKDLINDGGSSWNTDKIKQEIEDPDSMKLILATPIDTGNADKRDNSSSSSASQNKLWSLLWNVKAQPKVKNFVWKVCKNALPCRLNLFVRHLNVDPTCPCCNISEETIAHCLVGCNFAQAVWFGSQFKWNFSNVVLPSLPQWIEDSILALRNCGDLQENRITEFVYLLWYIWKARNEFVFEGMSLNPMETCKRAREAAWEFIRSEESDSDQPPPQSSAFARSARWVPPEENSIKLNVDAATDIENCKGAIAVIIRDHYGDMLTAISKRVPCYNAQIAESLAVREAMRFVLAFDIHSAVIESDCKEVVEHCLGRSQMWQIAHVLDEVKSFLSSHSRCSISKVGREGNKVADFAAKEALKGSLPVTWSWCPPVKIRALLLDDKSHKSRRK